ncbi:MAG: hypothetical protein Kow00129_05270 [Thermoleophilia bacterium]
MVDVDKLKEYEGKRDFSKTPEPKASGPKKSHEDPIFVVQQHKASRMHFDFRLEIDGTLASWAIPKGPSTDPREKRLAVRTEDHPVEYASFEGSIPEEEYGGGTVIVWDTGRWEHKTKDDKGNELTPAQALEKGHLSVRLHGQKLRGGYSLIHSKMGGNEKNWLLVKEKDDEADARRNPVSTETKSVVSGLTVEEMEERMRQQLEEDAESSEG